MLADPALPGVLAQPLIDAISFVWPEIRAAQRAGDFERAEKLAHKALEGATPQTIAIFESRVSAINGEIQ
ncbi:hypothetical protein [Mesorhizobium sp. M0167]